VLGFVKRLSESHIAVLELAEFFGFCSTTWKRWCCLLEIALFRQTIAQDAVTSNV
jgi:hypothetical protein